MQQHCATIHLSITFLNIFVFFTFFSRNVKSTGETMLCVSLRYTLECFQVRPLQAHGMLSALELNTTKEWQGLGHLQYILKA